VTESEKSPQWTGKSAVRSMLWIAVDKWGTRFVSLLTLVVLARLLAPADFGVVALASTFVTFASIFVDYGFSKALIQRRDLEPEHMDAAFWVASVLGVTLFAATLALAPLFAALMKTQELTPVLRWMAVALLINAVSGTPAALLERSLKFKQLAVRRVTSSFAGGAVGITVAVLGGGVWSLVAQTIVGSVVACIALWWASAWRPRFSFRMAPLRQLLPVGVGVFGIEVIGFLNGQADRLLIGFFMTPQDLGYYFMGVRVLQIMGELFSSVFSAMSLPAFSRMQDDRDRLRNWLYRFTGTSSMITLPIFFLAALLAPVAMPWVLGSQWHASVPIFQVLTFVGALTAVAYYDRSALLALGRTRTAFFLTFGQSVLGLILISIALPFGILAVAIAVAVRQYVYWPVRVIVLRNAIDIRPATYLGQWFRPFLACLAMGAAVYGCRSLWPALAQSPVPFVVVMTLLGLSVYGLVLSRLQPDALPQLRSAVQALRGIKKD
jgi:O-antigen/teichoic acid export membrane protein